MLPYAVLMHIPILSLARVPDRWDVLVMMSLAVLRPDMAAVIFLTNFQIVIIEFPDMQFLKIL